MYTPVFEPEPYDNYDTRHFYQPPQPYLSQSPPQPLSHDFLQDVKEIQVLLNTCHDELLGHEQHEKSMEELCNTPKI